MPAPGEVRLHYTVGGERRADNSVSPGTRGRQVESPTLAYQKKWEVGGKLYTEGTGAIETPMLAAMITGLPVRPGRKRLVIEAGAGSGDQAIHLARELQNTNVVALDTSPAAIRRIHERAPKAADTFASGSQMTVVLRDLGQSLDGLQPGTLDGFHANSVFHFIEEPKRAELLGTLSEKLTEGGLVAVSYKAFDPTDALVSDPRTRISPDHGKGLLVLPPDGIQRLFVDRDNTRPIQGEFTDAGLQVVGVYTWGVEGYDTEGKVSQFVGFLARKPAAGEKAESR